MTSYEEYGSEEPRGWSPLAVAFIATLVVLLGLGGALFGINAANRNTFLPTGTDTTAPQGVPTPTAAPTPTPTPTPAPTPTPTPAPADTFPVPGVTGQDFQAARTKIRDLKLGWQLVFEGTDPADAAVRATDPPVGAPVRKGTTVKIYVGGSAPLATVPDVRGLPCSQGAGLIVDHGLYPRYESGRDGSVLKQSPAATDPQTLRWNDRVRLSCGTPSP